VVAKKEETKQMARLILILGLALGFWMRDFQVDRSAFVGSPSSADAQVMDGCDPFPTFAGGR
jgi:hypothetical protein